eukprot:SAG31_NODE_19723_length_593_cov_1.117409_1_plen_85_part_10
MISAPASVRLGLVFKEVNETTICDDLSSSDDEQHILQDWKPKPRRDWGRDRAAAAAAAAVAYARVHANAVGSGVLKSELIDSVAT